MLIAELSRAEIDFEYQKYDHAVNNHIGNLTKRLEKVNKAISKERRTIGKH